MPSYKWFALKIQMDINHIKEEYAERHLKNL